MTWPALRAARAHNATARVPLRVPLRTPLRAGDAPASATVGSVARVHLARLRAWPVALQVHDDEVRLVAPPEERDAALADINATLHAEGLIRGWRDELYTLADLHTGTRLATIERAASRFWGSLTLGAHANGYVADESGQPTHLWIAQRSFSKPTDPGLHDNLVGGGVPSHQTPWQCLQREGYEEAGLDATLLRTATPGSVMRLQRDIPEGLQLEDLHAYDLRLPKGLVPLNQDGEVHGFQCLPVQQAIELAAGDTMTVDAALVTLDFALRHRLIAGPQAATLQADLQKLFVAAVRGDQKP